MTEAPIRPWHQHKDRTPRWLKQGLGQGRGRPVRLLATVLATGSCTTMQIVAEQPAPILAAQFALAPEAGAPEGLLDPAAAPVLSGETALQANAALPLVGAGTPAPATMILASATPLAQMRALDCLAQAIYYEARSESEAGQRAVAQVVLNRVRHPAWPNSVCGVVYQGPMRAGGGCQFTFTCDGSLRFAARGDDWVRARRLASEALSGYVYQPVGLATFYHANYVMPGWAPRLLKTAVVGAHLFYRLPGAGGLRGAFSSPYAGVEPIARPNPIIVRYTGNGQAAIVPAWLAPPVKPVATSGTAAPSPNLIPDETPVPTAAAPVAQESQVRPEYQSSGQWRKDAPAALTGR